jgi:hypothetical protein
MCLICGVNYRHVHILEDLTGRQYSHHLLLLIKINTLVSLNFLHLPPFLTMTNNIHKNLVDYCS